MTRNLIWTVYGYFGINIENVKPILRGILVLLAILDTIHYNKIVT